MLLLEKDKKMKKILTVMSAMSFLFFSIEGMTYDSAVSLPFFVNGPVFIRFSYDLQAEMIAALDKAKNGDKKSALEILNDFRVKIGITQDTEDAIVKTKHPGELYDIFSKVGIVFDKSDTQFELIADLMKAERGIEVDDVYVRMLSDDSGSKFVWFPSYYDTVYTTKSDVLDFMEKFRKKTELPREAEKRLLVFFDDVLVFFNNKCMGDDDLAKLSSIFEEYGIKFLDYGSCNMFFGAMESQMRLIVDFVRIIGADF
jgi:hypothetical protein